MTSRRTKLYLLKSLLRQIIVECTEHPRSPGHCTDVKNLIRYYAIYRKYEAMRPKFSVLDFTSFVRKCCKNNMV
jgi:hypothetical protein